MKKFFAMLMMATLVLSLDAVAGPTYDLSNGNTGEIPVLEPVQFNTNNTVYMASNLMVNYTVTESVNRRLLELKKDKDGNYIVNEETGKYETKWYTGKDKLGHTDFDLAHVYFTANDNYRMALFVDVDPNQTQNELFINSKLKLNDYGIYLYENNDPSTNHITEYISLKDGDYAITEGTNFGVWYNADTTYGTRVNPKYGEEYNATFDMSDDLGLTDTKNVTYTTAQNWVASFDWEKNGNHQLEADDVWYSDKDIRSNAAIFYMFQGPFDADSPAFLEWEHVEFGFVTTGQPLPGTLTTLLISGLCAAGLRKKNKK